MFGSAKAIHEIICNDEIKEEYALNKCVWYNKNQGFPQK